MLAYGIRGVGSGCTVSALLISPLRCLNCLNVPRLKLYTTTHVPPSIYSRTSTRKMRSRTSKIGSERCNICCNLRLGLKLQKPLGEKTTDAFLSNYKKTGCKYCLLLWASFAHFSDPDDAHSMGREYQFWIHLDHPGLLKCQKSYGRSDQSYTRPSEIIEFHLLENTAKKPSCVSSLLSSLTRLRPLWWIESSLLDQRPWFGPLHMFRYASTCSSNPSSAECMATVKRWLDQCVSTHLGCRTERDPQLPYRVIDLGPEKNTRFMRLVETDNEKRGKYLALSHRWGGSEPCQLEKGNLRDRLTEIRLAELPPNFTDAVHLSAELGVQYLWIDSLCIIQDDKEDWDRESAKMASIYRDSYLTIAASVSPNCYHGFLGPRPNTYTSFQPSYLGRPLPSPFDQVWIRRPVHDYPLYDDPLDSRFWVVQEQLLSTRVISYRRNEVKWQCKTCQGCECRGLSRRDQRLDIDSWMRRDFHRFIDFSSSNTNLLFRGRKYAFRHAFLRWWRLGITTISRKQLSRESDKLAALAGIASSIQTVTEDTYLAGMWKSDLPHSLGWRCSDYTRNSIPTAYRAPSWCWSSLTDMSLIYNVESPERGRRIYFSFTDMRIARFDFGTRSDATAAFKVVDVQCHPATSNPFGWVKEGAYLELKGYLFSAALMAAAEANSAQLTLRFQSIPTNLSVLEDCHVSFLADTLLAAAPLHNDDGIRNKITPTRSHLTSSDPSALSNCPVSCLYYSWYTSTSPSSNDSRSISRLDFLVLGRSPSIRGAYTRIGFCQTDVQRDFAKRFLKDVKALERQTLRIL